MSEWRIFLTFSVGPKSSACFLYKLNSLTGSLRFPYVNEWVQMRNSLLQISVRNQHCPLLAVRFLHQNRSFHR